MKKNEEVLRAVFRGDDRDPASMNIGIIRGGTYLIKLLHPNWFQRLLGEKGVIALVYVCGKRKYLRYETLRGFDANWRITENI